jgi:hypothetical protein
MDSYSSASASAPRSAPFSTFACRVTTPSSSRPGAGTRHRRSDCSAGWWAGVPSRSGSSGSHGAGTTRACRGTCRR